MNYWIDTHAHLYLPEFDTDRAEILLQCADRSINKIYMPNIDHTSIDAMLEAELKYSGQCVAMMGLHPCSVKADFEKELYGVEEWLGRRSFAAIGEIGTDLYWDNTFWAQQQEAFTIQVEWAKKFQRPVVIHCRESLNETLELIAPLCDQNLRGVFHCFSGSLEQAKRIVDLGFYLGIGGVVTFKNGGLDKVLPDIPLTHLVLETDSPYLAPVPHRGKRNSPLYLPLIAARLAALKNVSIEEVQQVTTQNAIKLFQ
jgi:TatD DNase family protein